MSFIYKKNQINDNINKKWTEYEENQLLNEIKRNININQLIIIHKRPEEEVKERLLKLMNEIINNDNNILELFYNIINNIKIPDGKLNNIKWTENEDKKIIEEVKSGILLEDLIKKHNRSNIDIKNRLIRLVSIIKDKNEKRHKELANILNIELSEFYEIIKNLDMKIKIVKNFNMI